MARAKRAYFFFSVHEKLFDPVARRLLDSHGLTHCGGMVWGKDQEAFLENSDVAYDPLLVFTRDVLPRANKTPDLFYLRERERRYGIPIQRMIWSERNLLESRSYEEALALAEQIFRVVEASFESTRPNCIISEDVGCLTSYIHYAVAKGMGIPFWRVGSARMPGLLSVYSAGLQEWEKTNQLFTKLRRGELTNDAREAATAFVESFRKKPERPTGMQTRARLPVAEKQDVNTLVALQQKYRADPDNPTLQAPVRALAQRALRLGRYQASHRLPVFDEPDSSERYVLFPIHYQPEASTLVQAPYYLDQAALIEDISKSLPVGYRLYVKEHVSNRGRRALSFYRRIRKTFGVRLLHPDENTWKLIQSASAIAVITGTVGWEGLLYGKPVVSFGNVFYNMCPLTYRAGEAAKDRWYDIFDEAIHRHTHDEEVLLKFVSAIQQTSYPGFMKNPNTFPQVLETENVERIANAIAAAARL